MDGFDTDRDSFLGVYNGADRPDVVLAGESKNSMASGWYPIGSHHLKVTLKPGEAKTYVFLLGYVENPKDDKWESLGVVKKAPALAIISRYDTTEKADAAFEELKKCFKAAPDDMVLTPPVYFDHGNRISFGKHFYANTDLTILDENYVTFGDNVFLAPHISIYTAGHPIDKDVRNLDLEYAKPVTIGDDVWIGGNVVINPGVTIGSNVVIASGSVVVKDIPSHVVAGGNPCHVIRQITEKDRDSWHAQLKDYEKDIKE